MATIGNLGIVVSARTEAFRKGMGKASGMVRGFSQNVMRSTQALRGYGAAIFAVAAGGGLALLIQREFAAVDSIAKMSGALGIGIDKLIGLQLAADLSGVGMKTLERSVRRMSIGIGEAAEGTGEAADTLKTLGLEAKKLVKMPMVQQLEEIGNAMDRVTDATAKVTFASDIFGSKGVDMINTLRGGTAAMDHMDRRARQLGLTVGNTLAHKIELANDAMHELRAIFTGTTRQIAGQVAPLIVGLTEIMTNWGTAGGGVGEKVAIAFDKIITGGAKLVQWFNMASTLWHGFFHVLGGLATGVMIILEKLWKFVPTLVGIRLFAKLLPGKPLESALTGLRLLREETEKLADESFAKAAASFDRFTKELGSQKYVSALKRLQADVERRAVAIQAAIDTPAAPPLPADPIASPAAAGSLLQGKLSRVAFTPAATAATVETVRVEGMGAQASLLERIANNTAGATNPGR